LSEVEMKKIAAQIAVAACFALLLASPAQARIFTPPQHWWSAGRSCVDSRSPPGLRWDDLPARPCITREVRQTGALPWSNGFVLASDRPTSWRAPATPPPSREPPGTASETPTRSPPRALPICSRTRFAGRIDAGAEWRDQADGAASLNGLERAL
jgi:hypothetical protein